MYAVNLFGRQWDRDRQTGISRPLAHFPCTLQARDGPGRRSEEAWDSFWSSGLIWVTETQPIEPPTASSLGTWAGKWLRADPGLELGHCEIGAQESQGVSASLHQMSTPTRFVVYVYIVEWLSQSYQCTLWNIWKCYLPQFLSQGSCWAQVTWRSISISTLLFQTV